MTSGGSWRETSQRVLGASRLIPPSVALCAVARGYQSKAKDMSYVLSMQNGNSHDCCPVFLAELVRDTSATTRSQTRTVGEHVSDIVRTGAAVLTVSDGTLSKFISRAQHHETTYNEKPFI